MLPTSVCMSYGSNSPSLFPFLLTNCAPVALASLLICDLSKTLLLRPLHLFPLSGSVFLWKSDLLTHCLGVFSQMSSQPKLRCFSCNLIHFPCLSPCLGLFFSTLHYYIYIFLLLLPFPLKCTFHEDMDFFSDLFTHEFLVLGMVLNNGY